MKKPPAPNGKKKSWLKVKVSVASESCSLFATSAIFCPLCCSGQSIAADALPADRAFDVNDQVTRVGTQLTRPSGALVCAEPSGLAGRRDLVIQKPSFILQLLERGAGAASAMAVPVFHQLTLVPSREAPLSRLEQLVWSQ